MAQCLVLFNGVILTRGRTSNFVKRKPQTRLSCLGAAVGGGAAIRRKMSLVMSGAYIAVIKITGCRGGAVAREYQL